MNFFVSQFEILLGKYNNGASKNIKLRLVKFSIPFILISKVSLFLKSSVLKSLKAYSFPSHSILQTSLNFLLFSKNVFPNIFIFLFLSIL